MEGFIFGIMYNTVDGFILVLEEEGIDFEFTYTDEGIYFGAG